MASKKMGIVCSVCFLILFTNSKVFPQSCGVVDKYISLNSRKYYLLDSSHNKTILNVPEIMQRMEPWDTSLAKEIIQNGEKNEDYESFFRQKGISIKAISYDKFDALPEDTVLLSKREIHLKKKFDTLWSRISALSGAGQYDNSLNKETVKKKYRKLQEKLSTQYPYLFIMFPIYKFGGRTLVMFEAFTRRKRESEFVYAICH